jgi:hypothetical protein
MWALRSRRGQRQNRQQRGKCSPLNLVVSSYHFYGNCGAKFSKMFGKLLPNNFKPVMETNHEWTRLRQGYGVAGTNGHEFENGEFTTDSDNRGLPACGGQAADATDRQALRGAVAAATQSVLFGSLPKSFTADSKSFGSRACRRQAAGDCRFAPANPFRRDSAVRGFSTEDSGPYSIQRCGGLESLPHLQHCSTAGRHLCGPELPVIQSRLKAELRKGRDRVSG